MNWPTRALFALTFLAAVGTGVHSRAQTQNQPPSSAGSRSDEMVDRCNDIGNILIAMAQDFPEDNYDFKVQKDERTFALNLLNAAALDLVLIRRISGSNVGSDFGEGDNPSRLSACSVSLRLNAEQNSILNFLNASSAILSCPSPFPVSSAVLYRTVSAILHTAVSSHSISIGPASAATTSGFLLAA
jgi:hypothetical protein